MSKPERRKQAAGTGELGENFGPKGVKAGAPERGLEQGKDQAASIDTLFTSLHTEYAKP